MQTISPAAGKLLAGRTSPGAGTLLAGRTSPGAGTLLADRTSPGAGTLLAGRTSPGDGTLLAGRTSPGAGRGHCWQVGLHQRQRNCHLAGGICVMCFVSKEDLQHKHQLNR
jgi:hypothetical protein